MLAPPPFFSQAVARNQKADVLQDSLDNPDIGWYLFFFPSLVLKYALLSEVSVGVLSEKSRQGSEADPLHYK